MDEIMSFVLVIVSIYTGEPVTLMPGYESQKACEAAARAYVAAETEAKQKTNRYLAAGHIAFCIPGPTRKS